MSDQLIASIVIAALTSLPPTLVALAALRQSRKNGKNSTAIGAVLSEKSDAIHSLADGRLDKMQSRVDQLEIMLKAALGSASHAEGKLEEQSEARSRDSGIHTLKHRRRSDIKDE